MTELRIVTKDELVEIIRKHELWSADKDDGERADLSYANLRYADLRYANLSYADLSCANLRCADLSYADLRYADLRYADLRYANLRYANLRCADLSYANLSCADLRYAKDSILAGQDIRGYLFWATVGEDEVVIVSAGCRRFVGIAAARAHWIERHGNDTVLHEDCLSLVERIAHMAKVRGWKLEPDQ